VSYILQKLSQSQVLFERHSATIATLHPTDSARRGKILVLARVHNIEQNGIVCGVFVQTELEGR